MKRVILATAIATLTLGLAGSAQAGNDFRRGFEHELGRIVAHKVATVTHFAFFHAPPPPPVVVRHVHRPRRVVVEHRVHYDGCGHHREVTVYRESRHPRARHYVGRHSRHPYGREVRHHRVRHRGHGHDHGGRYYRH